VIFRWGPVTSDAVEDLRLPNVERHQRRPGSLDSNFLFLSNRLLIPQHTSPKNNAMSVTHALKGDATHQVRSLVRVHVSHLLSRICSATWLSWASESPPSWPSDTTSCAPTLHSANMAPSLYYSTDSCCGRESNLRRTTLESTQNVAQGMRFARTKTSTIPAGYKSSYRRVSEIYKCWRLVIVLWLPTPGPGPSR